MISYKNIVDFLNKEKGISFVSVLAIFVSFTLLAFIISFLVFSNTALNILQRQVQIRVFFKDSFSEQQIMELKSELEADSRVQEVGYTSKDEALRIFKDLSKNDPVLQESLSTNILPASLEIRAKDVKDLDTLYEELITRESVESIKYLKDIKDKFKYFSNIILGISLFITLLFFIVSFGIIISTIRINIFQKKEEIEVMRLVGASDDFIRKPFIFQGIVYSMTGSFLAGLVFFILSLIMYFTNFLGIKDLGFVFLFGNFKIHFLAFSIGLVILINFVGYLLGRTGSKTAIQNYLQI
jgi:cell division transport system permease protein